MKLLIWIALFTSFIPLRAFSEEPCAGLLKSPPSHKELLELSKDILSHLEENGPEFEFVQNQIFGILTGFDPSFLESEKKTDQLIYRLQPIQRWKRIIGRTHWDGRAYVTRKTRGKEVHFNSFWGRPFNISPVEPVAININHSPQSKSSWINLSLGWTEISDQNLQILNKWLQETFPELSLHKFLLKNSRANSHQVLVLAGLNQHLDHLNFLDLLVDQLQDRHFQSGLQDADDPAQ
ncbi:MAG: hypothetical protein CL676_04385 [Bdellovibrionaceae bacterium]|nr:hypothetical protein [Pseudobdellovibrionaceae bacterium]|tara:strand:+ start:1553 stop:2260 length:708 start_codon:yes stop_codon:yes gene_type:complete